MEVLAFLSLLCIFGPLAFLYDMRFNTQKVVIHQKEGWIQSKEKILYNYLGFFEFEGFANESTLLFYERYDQVNCPVCLQIKDEKEMQVIVAGKTITVTKVDKENNRIEVKIVENKPEKRWYHVII